ncbi:histidinol-phosphate transaminase [Streptomyces sp. NPDC048430]|uniref:pyridoxal phosphate-dependent aminotransferase n=1 Tax=unclassified Streptomyces TaxID=2593676 RepID=UPI0034471B39
MRKFPSLVPFKAGPHALDPHGVERLALSESPFGASPKALAAARAEVERINHYPNSDTEPLRGELASHYGVPADWVLVGNGADELILLTVLATCAAGGRGVTTERTFAGYTAAFETAGLTKRLVPLDENGPDVDELVDQARTADITIVCNPHNPLGRALDSDEIRRVHQATVEGNGVLVLDEAYAEFAVPQGFTSGLTNMSDTDNIVVLRTFSKAYGLAGLRCGYAIGNPRIIDAMAGLRTVLPYNVNRVAIAAATAALQDQDHLRHVVHDSIVSRTLLAEGLARYGIRCLPSQANFVLAEVGPQREAFVQQLVSEHAIQVRDGRSLGFDRHVRIGVCRPDTVARVVSAVADVHDRLTTPAGVL